MGLRDVLARELRERGVEFEDDDLLMVDRWAEEIARDEKKLQVLVSLLAIRIARRGLAEAMELRGVVESALRIGLLFL